MNLFWVIFEKFKAFGMFVSSIINYILLLLVYVIGVGLTWIFVKLGKKQLLFYGEGKSCWHNTQNDHSLDKAKRMF